MCFSLLLLSLLVSPGELHSGPQPGKKFGPYTFLIATGPNRGTSHCYVCETGNDPAIIILARSSSVPFQDFLKQVDQALSRHKSKNLRGWVTYVGMKQPAREPELTSLSRKLGLRTLPLGIYEPAEGPPGYQLHADADVTILLVKDSKVLHNFAYTSNGLNAAEAKKILDLVPKILK